MSYRVALTKSAVKELDGLPPKIHDKVIDHLRQLEENPRIVGAEKAYRDKCLQAAREL